MKTLCFYDNENKKMCHIWSYSGSLDYFPYEDMLCSCGEQKYHKSKQEEERIINNLYAQDWVKDQYGRSKNRGLISTPTRPKGQNR